MRAVFDKNVPVGVRRFLTVHEMPTFVEVQWHPQLENGELLRATEAARFDVMVTSDQNIVYQQNLTGRKLALVVLGREKVEKVTGGKGDGRLFLRYVCSREHAAAAAFSVF